MKILVFEYIVGGGLAQDELSASLVREGELMLQALANELAIVPGVQQTILLDKRCKELVLPNNIETILVSAEQDIYDLLAELIDDFDYVWPIAPEMGAVLQNLSVLLEGKSKCLLNSSSEAVALCTDKYKTSLVLTKTGINTVETIQLDRFSNQFVAPWVIKPKDGVGCVDSYLVSDKGQLDKIVKQIVDKSDYIIQPYIKGESLSLSCLFKNGQAWLLCCNQQQISIVQNRFELNACVVNLANGNRRVYQRLVDRIALEIPGLWGYVGIDLIQSEFASPLVLEINPRLTTSYVGIQPALGINVAKMVLDMIDKRPQVICTQNEQITVLI